MNPPRTDTSSPPPSNRRTGKRHRQTRPAAFCTSGKPCAAPRSTRWGEAAPEPTTPGRRWRGAVPKAHPSLRPLRLRGKTPHSSAHLRGKPAHLSRPAAHHRQTKRHESPPFGKSPVPTKTSVIHMLMLPPIPAHPSATPAHLRDTSAQLSHPPAHMSVNPAHPSGPPSSTDTPPDTCADSLHTRPHPLHTCAQTL